MKAVTFIYAPKIVRVGRGRKSKWVRDVTVNVGGQDLITTQVDCAVDTPDKCYVIEGVVTAVV